MHTATYSPQDNKIRLFFAERISKEEWNRLKTAGFSWTMKQKSDMVAHWTPDREDIALEYAEEIEDEDQPRAERAAERAERFGGYRDSGQERTGDMLDRIDRMPDAYGHQNHQVAANRAARRDRLINRTITSWSKPEYWQKRTERVIAHELYLEQPAVRHRRLKGIRSDLRKLQKRYQESYEQQVAYRKRMINMRDNMNGECKLVMGPLHRWDFEPLGYDYDIASEYGFDVISRVHLYSILGWERYRDATSYTKAYPNVEEPVVATLKDHMALHGASCAEILELYFTAHPEDPQLFTDSRWIRHYELRIAYEEAMIKAVGGTIANAHAHHDGVHAEEAEVDAIVVPGGWFGTRQVQKISKDRNGDLAGIYFFGKRYAHQEREYIYRVKAESLSIDHYRAPTMEELTIFNQSKKDIRKETTGTLVNVSVECATNLIKELFSEAPEDKRPSVKQVTQARYSAMSKGDYAHYGTCTLFSWSNKRIQSLDKIRVFQRYDGFRATIQDIVVLTDKKQVTIKPTIPVPELTQTPARQEVNA